MPDFLAVLHRVLATTATPHASRLFIVKVGLNLCHAADFAVRVFYDTGDTLGMHCRLFCMLTSATWLASSR